MKIEISAPGKIILHGEHAVVYEKAAIAVSLSLRTRLTLTSSNDDKVILELKDLGISKEWKLSELNNCSLSCTELGAGSVVPADDECVEVIVNKFSFHNYSEAEKLALVAFLYLWIHISKSYNIGTFPSCHICVESDLSVGSGMGSSASYSVCLSAAILILCGRITPSLLSEDKQLINKWAFQGERVFHGKPSGIDNSICSYGGAVLFKNRNVVEILPDMKNIHILLVDSKVSRNTKCLVAGVKRLRQRMPTVIDPILDSIGSISSVSWEVLKALNDDENVLEKIKELQDLVRMNQLLLDCLDVGHKKLEQIFEIAKKHSCSAKLTGAGGGGCAFIMIPANEGGETSAIKALQDELEACGFKAWDVFLGHTGVQVKFHNA